MNRTFEIFTKGIWKENPVLVLLLGTCPTLALTTSATNGLGMGLGFLVALVLIATLREVLGSASFAGIAIPFLESYKISILTEAPGGFLVYGILIAIMNRITAKRGGVKKKSFSCEACPSSGSCQKTACEGVATANNNCVKEGE